MRALFFLTALLVANFCFAEKLIPFEFEPAKDPRGTIGQSSVCSFGNLKLPSDFAVYAAGEYSGKDLEFQIDQSGHAATQIDVAVNSTNKPVVLMLGAYEPTIWNIGWTKGTQILAVLVSGYHRQVVAGLERKVPLLISTHHNKGPCNSFYVSSSELESLNPQARLLFGRPVDMVYLSRNGNVVVGEPLTGKAKLVTSAEISPDSYRDATASLAGAAGLADAVKKGQLRKATIKDAEAWQEALAKNAPKRDIPPVAQFAQLKPRLIDLYNAYVVLKPFTYPAGLYGGHSATFFIPADVPLPSGNEGHSTVLDFNSLQCKGSSCPPVR